MNRASKKATVVAATTLGLLAAAAAPAAGGVWSHEDARRDVLKVSFNPVTVFDDAPGNRNTDITRFVVRHTDTRVIVRTGLRDLNADSGLARYRFLTSNAETYRAEQTLGDGDTVPLALDVSAAADPLYLVGPSGQVSCPGAEVTANRSKDFARLSIPRSCLGAPTWVRAGATVYTIGADGPEGHSFFDAALTALFAPDATEEDLAFVPVGARVFRG